MRINITLTEEQAKDIKRDAITETTLEEMVNELMMKLVQDKEYTYEKNMELVNQLMRYLEHRNYNQEGISITD